MNAPYESRLPYDVEEAKKNLPGFDPLVYWVLSELDGYLPAIQFSADAHKRVQEALEEYASRQGFFK